MNVRYKDGRPGQGSASRFNTHGIGLIFVYWNDGDISEEFASSLEVQIDGAWKPLADAFRDHDVITDNYNTRFFEPRSTEDRERGYTL